jgi:hypothetical protein
MHECSIFSTHDASDTKCKHVQQLWIMVKILSLEEAVDFFNSQNCSKSTAIDASLKSLLFSPNADSESEKWWLTIF